MRVEKPLMIKGFFVFVRPISCRNMTKDEIAKAVGCGVSTVYRVAKSTHYGFFNRIFKCASRNAIVIALNRRIYEF